ncbi:MAG: hypothetical protein ACKO3W_04890, partial [bacterium]
MDLFSYRNGELFVEDLPVRAVAAAAGTPCYIYSRGTIERHYDRLVEAFRPIDPLVCYSVKSLSNVNILRVLAARGAGMDVVSGGELQRAGAAMCATEGGLSVSPASTEEVRAQMSKCVYAGVGKSDADILSGILAGIGLFNCESEQEFENIARIARMQR